MTGDGDVDRKTQAEVLLNAYSRELERRRLDAGAQGLLITDSGELSLIKRASYSKRELSDDDDLDDDESEEGFHYPGSSSEVTPRPPSIGSTSTDYFQRTQSRGPADLTPHLSQAPEFRVPTHEAPQKVLSPRWIPPTPHSLHAQWERDEVVSTCRSCQRRFNFITRRVSLLITPFCTFPFSDHLYVACEILPCLFYMHWLKDSLLALPEMRTHIL